MENAPLHAGLAQGPEGGNAYWLRCADTLRIRIAVWRRPGGDEKGTVLLFPGRTEYIEKFGLAVAEMAARGYAVLVVDWRGQGLADRLTADPLRGHVNDFAEYQTDVAAVMEAVTALGLPRPLHLLAHSMGGAIGLRALTRGLPVASAAFSAPMWGIAIPAYKRPIARPLTAVNCALGRGETYAPDNGPVPYVYEAAFAGNMLTTDAAMYARMIGHLAAEPGLTLSGPTMRWLNAALAECRTLTALASPDVPALASLGSNERIVDPQGIRNRMARWPRGQLLAIEGGEHEVMMETPPRRTLFFDSVAKLFDENA
jgi:lysophospholipase